MTKNPKIPITFPDFMYPMTLSLDCPICMWHILALSFKTQTYPTLPNNPIENYIHISLSACPSPIKVHLTSAPPTPPPKKKEKKERKGTSFFLTFNSLLYKFFR